MNPDNFSPESEYYQRLSNRESTARRLHQKHIWLGNVRIVLFIVIAVLWWVAGTRGRWYFSWLAAAILIFIGLVFVHRRIVRAMQAARRAVAFYQRGLARIEDRWFGSGDTGEKFRAPDHVYAEDLDILGSDSLFQLLCCARTQMGEASLAQWLLAPAGLPVILQRQAAVRELKEKLDFREYLAVAGETDKIKADAAKLTSWANRDAMIAAPRWWPAAIIMAVITTAALIYGFIRLWFPPFLFLALVNFVVLYFLRHKLAKAFEGLDDASSHLSALAAMLRRIETEKFESPLLQALQAQLFTHGNSSSEGIGKLSTLWDYEESRHNMMVKLLEFIALYSIHVAFLLQAWRKRYGHSIQGWLNTVAEMEALVSLSAYTYEHPADKFPTFTSPEDSPRFEGEALGHPLLPSAICVRNSVTLELSNPVLMVSGSNMSGKSTLLRTVGINTVLAMMGAPVRAERLFLSPLRLGTSMRLSDSLHKGVSHFYAEIQRIRDVVELSRTGPLLFLFDEVLQGTNSHDRRAGAEGILRTLLEHGALGLVTTHDLALTSIADVFPGRIRNVHFQEKLDAGKLSFDYRLREGVVTTSNGIELMKSIGLEV
ncbi:MAG TPA: mismatch repair protein [Candidatus Angelobacter sp.]|jgi:energy-coupling factor transporter transmembrane protein EcfT|nr:mismatch repair protein [Candidatus Angelobacter sp.]